VRQLDERACPGGAQFDDAARPPSELAAKLRAWAAQRAALRLKANEVEPRGRPLRRRRPGAQDEGGVDAVEESLASEVVARHRRHETDEVIRISQAARPESVEHIERRLGQPTKQVDLRGLEQLGQRVEHRLCLLGVPAIELQCTGPTRR
jgi:hypothetical protein